LYLYGEGEDGEDLLMWSCLVSPFLLDCQTRGNPQQLLDDDPPRSQGVGQVGVRTIRVVKLPGR